MDFGRWHELERCFDRDRLDIGFELGQRFDGDRLGFGLDRDFRFFRRFFLGFGDLLGRGVRLDFGVVRLASFEPGGGEIELDLGRAAVEAAREALEEFL